MRKANPDAAIVAGDIVYPSGRLKYYGERWFGVMNPLLHSRLSAGVPGNHDIEECMHLGAKPDCLAYFYMWHAPLNGPAGLTIPVQGPTEAFRQAAGDAFPRTANYSFDYGPVHFTVLDSNHYMDWTRPDLRKWLEDDLAASKRPWRIVLLHHAPFHSTRKHAEQQRMRVLAPLFEKHKVAFVFAGHVHNYQRSHAIRFVPDSAMHPLGTQQRISGKVIRDEAQGVVYIVTGAGGAGLHDAGSSANPLRWQEFTAKFEARQHSFTLLEASSTNIAIRQIGADGRELDLFQIARK
jgi:predicted phosphodiesterase